MATTIPRRRINYMAPVEDITAKFALQKDKCKNSSVLKDTIPPPVLDYFGSRVLRRKTRAAGEYTINSFYYRKNPRLSPPTAKEMSQHTAFLTAVKSAAVTIENLMVITQIQADYTNKQSGSVVPVPVREGVNSAYYATLRGWVVAVRMAQIKNGESITATTDTWFS